MSALSEWARGLVCAVIISSFLELLLPKGDMKKYVSFTAGFVIILFLISPLKQMRGSELTAMPEVPYKEYAVAELHDEYAARLERRVERDLGLDGVEITVNPSNLAEIIYVKADSGHGAIAEYLGLTADKVGD